MSDITTLDGALDELRARVRGAVLGAGEPGEREVFNAMHPSSPAVTIRCTGTADVVAGVNFAREHGLPLAVRGGGHSIAGLSAIDGGVLLDLAPMRGVHVDPERQLAVVQGGALWADVDRETQAYGLVAPGGVVSDTGVAGLTLGGGYGWVRRKYGLSVDALEQAQVVCADGQVRTASADSHPDLFWALRGGGGNFGVVTAFTFALRPAGPIVGFAATFYPLEEIDSILRRWRAFVATAPDEVTSVVVTITFPANPELPEVVHDRPVAIVGGVYVGDPEEGLRVMAPLRELGTPLFDMSGPTPFTAVQSGFDPLFPRKQAARVLEVPIPRRALGRGDRRDRRPGTQPARAVDARQYVPHGRRDRRRGPRGHGVRATVGALHGLDRRHVAGPGRRRRHDRLDALGLGGDRRARQRQRLPELHRLGRGNARRRRRRRVRTQRRAAGRGQDRLRPGQPVPSQPQHRAPFVDSAIVNGVYEVVASWNAK